MGYCAFPLFRRNILKMYSNIPFLYSLETSKNERLSDVFRRYRNETLG